MTGQRRFYQPELDALRLAAFFLVFCSHGLPSRAGYLAAGVPGWIWRPLDGFKQGGVYGVDVFFLLSAYLITEILLREQRRTASINVGAFWTRRILRIWPLYFCFLALAYWVIPVFYPPKIPSALALAYATFWGNFAAVTVTGISLVVQPLWSVSVEEQFYFGWPLILRSFVAYLQPICIGLLVIANVSRIVLLARSPSTPWILWSNTLTRMDPIAIGALLASVLHGGVPQLRTWTRRGLLLSGLLLIGLTGIYLKDAGWLVLLGYPVAAVAALLLMLGTLGAPGRIPAWVLYLGRISYGLYVFHALALVVVRSQIRLGGAFVEWAVQFTAALSLTILLAAASYRWLERPFLRIKERFTMDQPERTAAPSVVPRLPATVSGRRARFPLRARNPRLRS